MSQCAIMLQPQAAGDTVVGSARRASREITHWCGFSAEHERGSELVVRPDVESKRTSPRLGNELQTFPSDTEGCRAQFRDALSTAEGVLAMFTPRGSSLQSRIDSIHTSGPLTARDVSGQESQSQSMNYRSIFDRILDRLLFPAPTPSYDLSSFGDELLLLPRDDGEQVPCLFIKCSFSRFVFIYFHANAEDIGNARDFCIKMSTLFQVHVLTVEYPGYGLCSGKADEPGLQANAKTALRFVTEALRWPTDSVIIIGRSMGTGPAVALAAKLPDLGGLILVSPYTSIQSLIRHHVGSLAHLVTERFPSDQIIHEVKAPTMIIHGKQDILIPPAHGQKLFNLLRNRKMLVTPEMMGHNTALFRDLSWFVQPMFEFFPCPDYTFEDIDIPSWASSGKSLSQQTRSEEISSDNRSTTASITSCSSSSGTAERITNCPKHPVSLANIGSAVLTYMPIVKPVVAADRRSTLAAPCDAETSSSEEVLETAPAFSTTKLPTLLTTRPRVKPIVNFIAK